MANLRRYTSIRRWDQVNPQKPIRISGLWAEFRIHIHLETGVVSMFVTMIY
jgi:hypothetical protein